VIQSSLVGGTDIYNLQLSYEELERDVSNQVEKCLALSIMMVIIIIEI
jgi:hypothetical protein